MMKGGLYIFFFTVFMVSCRVTENNLVGYYRQSDSTSQQKLLINKSHTFVYTDYHSASAGPIDSVRFETKGTWVLKENKLVLNSFDKSYSDTAQIASVLKTGTEKRTSNFSFQDVYGNMIAFDEINEGTADDKGPFEVIADAAYTDYDLDLKKHKILIFNLTMQGEYSYKPVVFSVKDTTPADYKITVEPYYRQGYFINKVLLVRQKKIIDGHLKYLRANPIIKITSDFYIRGPMHR